jgi:hypothetical protein
MLFMRFLMPELEKAAFLLATWPLHLLYLWLDHDLMSHNVHLLRVPCWMTQLMVNHPGFASSLVSILPTAYPHP